MVLFKFFSDCCSRLLLLNNLYKLEMIVNVGFGLIDVRDCVLNVLVWINLVILFKFCFVIICCLVWILILL